jgi:NAD(P)-dependent dehydrogenase (short-subunit alcohol dehydrogenase family)
MPKAYCLTNRVALITGGARMGDVIARALALRGAHVALSCLRSEDAARAAAASVEQAGRRALVVQADLANPASCERLVDTVASQFGKLDVLVAMASVFRRTALADLTEEEWRAQLAVDLDATFLCARAAVPHMRRAGGGRIVTFTDWVAASGRPRYRGYVPYFVAKVCVKAVTEALALELAPDGILVNAIAPGPILPAVGSTAEEQAAVLRATPLGRWGEPEAVAHAVVALVESGFITGETIRVDGGRHLA